MTLNDAAPPLITRRQVLVGALLAFASSWAALRGLHGDASHVAAFLRELFPDLRTAAAMGALYLQSRPEERSAEWLVCRLFGSAMAVEADRCDRDQLTKRLHADRHRDFCADDLVVLHGWTVTRTEARLLALVSLSSSSA